MFKTACPSCESIIKVKDDAYIGRRAKCPKCGESTVLNPLAEKPLGDPDLGDPDDPEVGRVTASDEAWDGVWEDEEEDEPVEPVRWGPRGAPTPSSSPAASPARSSPKSSLPPHWIDRRLETTAVAWEVLMVLSLAWSLISAVCGIYWISQAGTAEIDPSPRVNLAAAAYRAWAYAAFAAVGTSLLSALVSWTVAGFLRASTDRRDR